MQKKYSPITNIGSVSLLMTFIILCLVVFAMLSLSGAVSEYQYSQKIAQHNQDYYQASNEAVQMLRQIDRLLHAAYETKPDIYYAVVEEQLAGMRELQTDFTEENPTVTYEIPISSSQLLKVILTLNPPEQMEYGYYNITTWQEVPSSGWNGDDSLNLLQL